eukprot:TRINITY_DN2632_c0_g1_i2.p1 TRINITY_DN2632_c0_g1~~TRINITY_DN2632_c0_g1_i2.p1  ORF type:complete len:433 (-),score=60.75 TRINITY_DN2632_c0_g1_i2:83-1381(-)
MFLSNFASSDSRRPSFFEMLAAEQLMPAFRPALKFIFSVVAMRNPRANALAKYSDEVFYLLTFFVERHFLRNYDASFSENFYMLRRSAVDSSPEATAGVDRHATPTDAFLGRDTDAKHTPFITGGGALRDLRRRDRMLSLVMLVLIPYVKAKLDDVYESVVASDLPARWERELGEEEERSDQIGGAGRRLGGANDSLFRRMCDLLSRATTTTSSSGRATWRWKRVLIVLARLFRAVYPSVHLAYQGQALLFALFYTHDAADSFNIFFRWFGLRVRRLAPDDMARQQQETALRHLADLRRHRGAGLWRALRRGGVRSAHFLLDYSQFLLPLSVFFFKFIEWWYSNENSLAPDVDTPIPPPPKPPRVATGGLPLPKDKSLCPLCREPRTNPALSSSGFVFCYPCIFKYVETYRTCPVTHLPCLPDQVRKVYSST